MSRRRVVAEGVGVSDEQLDQWDEDTRASVLAFGSSRSNERVIALLGEVRASHAREAEQRAATILANKVWAEAAAERDVLQQRIDKAEAEYRELRRRITTVHCWTNEDGRQFLFADDVRAALTGTGDTE